MKEIKVQVIQAKDEFELVKKINSSKLDIFATTPIQKNNGDWVAYIYYNSNKKAMEDKQVKDNSTSKIGHDSKPAFIPSKEQLERWKKSNPTEKTLNLLKKKGYSDKELEFINTQYDAHVILENLKKENI